MRWSVIYLFCLWQSCRCAKEIDLYFSSNNCDEEPRTISETKGYNLTWDGQISPKLCSFTFTSGERGSSTVYEVCFVSIVYDLPSDVQIKIKNHTKSSWTFDRSDRYIPRTCVRQAYKLNITIKVPPGYRPPLPEIYLQLEVTAVKAEALTLTVAVVIITSVIAGIIFVCFVCICCGACESCGDCVRGLCECCGDILQTCLKCECLGDCECPSCDCPSCDCDCQDVCKPCGECCTAWAGCCTSVILSSRQTNSNNQQSDIQREIDEIPHLTEEIHTSTSATGFIEQPPSYHSVKGAAITSDPLLPPPSYEEVTQKTVPTAPPLEKYF